MPFRLPIQQVSGGVGCRDVSPTADYLSEVQETRKPRAAAVRESETGRRFSLISLALALASVALAPVVLGPLGILTGTVAVGKGDRYLGMLGLTASAVLSVTGYYLAGALLN